MKRIKFEKIKKGDYIKAVISDKQYKANKEAKYSDFWKSTYFQVTNISNESGTVEIETNKWTDFDDDGKYLRVLEQWDSLSTNNNCNMFFKLTEDEYRRKVGKYLIASNL